MASAMSITVLTILIWVLGANQSLRANYRNFNLDHRINIQGAWGIGSFYNLDPPLDWVITLLQIPLPPLCAPPPWILI